MVSIPYHVYEEPRLLCLGGPRLAMDDDFGVVDEVGLVLVLLVDTLAGAPLGGPVYRLQHIICVILILSPVLICLVIICLVRPLVSVLVIGRLAGNNKRGR